MPINSIYIPKIEVLCGGIMPDRISSRTGLYLAIILSACSYNCSGRPVDWSPTAPTEISSDSTTEPDPNPSNPNPAPEPTPNPIPPPPTPVPTPPQSPSSLETLIGAGDIGDCGTPGASLTARIIEKHPTATVFTTGDNAYPHGSGQDFMNCYDPSWGRFKNRTRPIPGNHDRETQGGAPYFKYFGERAGPFGLGYYFYNLGSWHITTLDSETMGKAGEAAMRSWLMNDLSTNNSRCTIVMFHHPPFSSGRNYASWMRGIFEILYWAGTEIVVTGHEHFFERYLSINPKGEQGTLNGVDLFIAGTGGAPFHSAGPRPTDRNVIQETWGIILFTLGPLDYQWQFIDINGGVRASGGGKCHDTPRVSGFTEQNYSRPAFGFRFTPSYKPSK